MRVRNKIIATILFITFSGMVGMHQVDDNKVEEVQEVQKEVTIELSNNIGTERSQFVVIRKFEPKETEEETISENEIEVEEESNDCELLQFPQLSDEDIYYLRKIATCEAGNQSVETMSLIMLTVLNRVKDDGFPNTIYEVIMECNNGKYQFSVVRPGGTWWYMEPNEESEEAFNMVWETLYDYSDGALYFESCESTNNWHSRNLEFLYQSGDVRFYK